MSVSETNISLGEQLLWAFFRLVQMVKIHQANNRLIIEAIAEFREALHLICQETDGANVRLHRGRFFLNQERLNFRPSMAAAVTKLMDYLQVREIQGIRFYEKEDLTNEELVNFAHLLNRAEREKDPVGWLQVQLDTANYTWIEFLVDRESKLLTTETATAENEAADPEAETDYKPEKHYSNSVSAELARRTYAQVMASMARRTYSHALTSVLNITDKFSSQKNVGIQKSKRVIQGMIGILTQDESILLGMSTIRNYDDYTYTHSVNVAILSMCLGRRLGLSQTFVEQLGLSGLFHDLGKVDVPISLISKAGGLTADEYRQVQTHSLHSVRQIIRLNADHALKSRLLLPPFEHHLGINLSGYPPTSRKAPLSLLGRILAVADHYDAMTSSRSYRVAPISPDIALKIMLEEAGTVLDPVILKVFVEMIGIYPVGSLLILNSREVGLAVETPQGSEDGLPVVLLLGKNAHNQIIKKGYVNLSEKDETGLFRRSVVRCCHPADYGIQPANFLI
ncbi:MAG: HD domain-containing protein [Candidatus Adiutrix sp.]|nr:HD domain-containing protein [Candidatus Adiutrix sp.]